MRRRADGVSVFVFHTNPLNVLGFVRTVTFLICLSIPRLFSSRESLSKTQWTGGLAAHLNAGEVFS